MAEAPIFSDSFVDDLPDDGLLAARALYLRFGQAVALLKNKKAEEVDHLYLDALGLLAVWGRNVGQKFPLEPTQALGPVPSSNIDAIRKAVEGWHQSVETAIVRRASAAAEEKYEARLGSGFAYEFKEDDLSRLQELINQLRDQIASCEALGDEHRRRLLARLERLQAELHKRVADLDRFWGLIGDAAVAAQLVGDAAKPIVETVYMMTGVIWKVTCIAHNLAPSPVPTLPPPGSKLEA